MKISWRFPPSSGGPTQGYTNNDIEGFKGEELIDNLAREICQNSLDAHDDNDTEAVRVVFELKQVPTAQYDVFSGYSACLDGCRRFWAAEGDIDAKLATFLTEAETVLSKPTINVLVASDYHTKGLLGNQTPNKQKTPWRALTGAEGISVKSDDNSGGSFGIGKNAPFACSSLSMVFYNTWDLNGDKAFIGVGKLATLLDEHNEATQRVGYYQKNNDEDRVWLPIYSNDECAFRDLFVRNEQGTDVIVVGFNEADNWQDNITKAVIKNFFVAIYENNLVVEINNGEEITRIDSTKIAELIEKYAQTDAQLEVTRQLFLAFSNYDIKVPIEVLGESDAVEIYIKSESSFSRTIANFRSTGMLVGKGYRRIFQHYAAILIVRGKKLGELLRDCEPPRHNRWDYKLIKGEANKKRRDDAKKALALLDEQLLQLLKAQYETPAGDSTDAPGMSAYLADTEDGTLPEESAGKDILKVKIKIGKPKVRKAPATPMDIPGADAEGGKQSVNGGSQGRREGPGYIPPDVPPFPGPGPGPNPGPNPGPSDVPVVKPGTNGTEVGVAEGNGNRSIPVKELSKRRVFPVATNLGLYKAVILPSRDYEKLFVECVVVGEDGKRETLEISKFMYQGKAVPCSKGKAGPLKVTQGIPAEFMITFDKKAKMGLNLILSEGGRK